MDLVETLRELGYLVVGEAGDGAAGIEVVRATNPDLVFMDVNMPVMDGITATRAIVGEDLAAVVMVTAYAQRSVVDEAVAAGAAGYIVKPFSSSDLAPAIEVAVAQRLQLRALRGQVASLAGRAQSRSLVEQAVTVLGESQGLGEPEAYALLRRAAMDQRVTLPEAAALILERIQGGISQKGHE
ncbi:MAG: response regulator [Actinobacteria bacterium]|nr:response regulator [Actinomycetota bacterium]